MEDKEPQSTNVESDQLRLNCLLEEYRAMYGLVQFRMSSLDRRIPIAGAALTATLASTGAIPDEAMLIVFFGLPLALLWFFRTTINHARSFEDVLRRIEQIEHEINAVLGQPTLCFQSRHPSRGTRVGGRTGGETIGAVMVTVVTLLLGCGFMFVSVTEAPWEAMAAYGGYLAVILSYIALIHFRLKRYEYQPH